MLHLPSLRSSHSALPITPAAAKAARVKSIPAEVIEVVNELIVKNLKQHGLQQIHARIEQTAVEAGILSYASMRDRLCEEFPGIDLDQAIVISGWLDFEQVYRDNGWTVRYCRPSFDENFKAFYEFTSNT